jgi:threonylcarbamoyladenosine tRNA methylthiotransferase MtaB
MLTFSVVTLGCKVNQYEGDRIADLLRGRGLRQVEQGGDVRVVHTCSVTLQAAGKSRQAVRRAGRVPLTVLADDQGRRSTPVLPSADQGARVIVTGCWATSDPAEAARLPGVDAVLPNDGRVAEHLHRLLDEWSITTEPTSQNASGSSGQRQAETEGCCASQVGDDVPVENAGISKTIAPAVVNGKSERLYGRSLPVLHDAPPARQRALLKVQDGCDAHCSYCIIPQLRPALHSRPVEEVVEEAQRLVDAGHVEVVLTGIFMGAYGQPTALRRRQPAGEKPLAGLIRALCTRVRGLRRVRLSSLEPGDLDDRLLATLRDHEQVAPHFHLPLQSGSDRLLRRMNRQYGRDDFLRMVDAVRGAFDRPALTTDVIVGFPGETDEELQRTLEVVDHAEFIHVHAFSFSPRPRTAAARWTRDFVRGPVVNQRIAELRRRAEAHAQAFQRSFLGEAVEVIVENSREGELPRGRCERYFEVYFDAARPRPGEVVRATVDRVTPEGAFGVVGQLASGDRQHGLEARATG